MALWGAKAIVGYAKDINKKRSIGELGAESLIQHYNKKIDGHDI